MACQPCGSALIAGLVRFHSNVSVAVYFGDRERRAPCPSQYSRDVLFENELSKESRNFGCDRTDAQLFSIAGCECEAVVAIAISER